VSGEVKQVLEKMEGLEGRYGVEYSPRQARCSLCGRKVLADLHLIPLFEGGSAFTCLRCLLAEREKYHMLKLEESGESGSRIEDHISNRLFRQAQEDFARGKLMPRRLLTGIKVRRGKPGYRLRFKRISVSEIEALAPVQIPEQHLKWLRGYDGILKRKGYYSPQRIQFLLNALYFIDRYRRGRDYGLNLPKLSVEEQVLTGAIYSCIYKRPTILPLLSRNLEEFYNVLPKLTGYGIFPYEYCFIRPSEVFRLTLWSGGASIYIYALFYGNILLKKLLLRGEHGGKGIVIAAFYRGLMRVGKRWKQPILPVKSFLEKVGGCSRKQFYNMVKLFDWLKNEPMFDEEYRILLESNDSREVCV